MLSSRPGAHSPVKPVHTDQKRIVLPGHPHELRPDSEMANRRKEIERWSTGSTFNQKEVFLEDSQRKLPGSQPVVATFFDRGFFRPDLALINETWRAKTGSKPDEFPDKLSAIDAYFELHRGKTVILVGHVAGDSFVLTNESGAASSALPIRALTATAKMHNVVLIAVGCETAATGFPFGLSRQIDAAGVQRFLVELGGSPTYYDLLRAMSIMGPLALDLDSGLALMRTAPTLSRKAPDPAFDPAPVEAFLTRVPNIFIRAELPIIQGRSNFGGASPRWVFVSSVWGILLLTSVVEQVSLRLGRSSFVSKHRRLANHLGTLLQMHTLGRWMRKAATMVAMLGTSFAITYGAPPLLTLVTAAMVGISTYLLFVKRSGE